MNETLYTVQEVAAYFKVGKRTVWRWVASGKMPSLKIHGIRRITHQAIDQFMSQFKDS